MNDRVLVAFLNAGLLELNGQDAWFEHITQAADQLATHLAEHPQELAGFVYSAIDPSIRDNDPARTIALETLKSVWLTFASVSIGPLDTVLRGVILDAVVQNANQDPQTKLALTLLLSSVLPYIKHGADAKVWQAILDELIGEMETNAEAAWSVPTEVKSPNIPKLNMPNLSGKLGGVKIDQESLIQGMKNATGATNADEGNAYMPHQHPQQWIDEFSKLSAAAINESLQKLAGARTFSLKTDEFIDAVSGMVEDYISLASSRLTAASNGVDLRTRLLWWK